MPRQVQWLNANQYRAYPLVEDSDMDFAGGTLATDVLLDFQAVTYAYTTVPVRLTQFEISGVTVTFTFDYQGVTTFVVSVPASAAFPFAVSVSSSIHRVAVIFGTGITDLVSDLGDGTYVFSTPPVVEPALISFQDIHRVTTVTGGSIASVDLTGPIYIEESYNCSVGIKPEQQRVRISAVRGAGAGITCDPTDDVVLCSEVLLRINGMHGNTMGDFVLGSGAGVQIENDPDNNQIIIRATARINEMVCECNR